MIVTKKNLINPFHGNVPIYFNTIQYSAANTIHKKFKFSINNFFSFLRFWSHLIKKSLIENLMFCIVTCCRLINGTENGNTNTEWNKWLTHLKCLKTSLSHKSLLSNLFCYFYENFSSHLFLCNCSSVFAVIFVYFWSIFLMLSDAKHSHSLSSMLYISLDLLIEPFLEEFKPFRISATFTLLDRFFIDERRGARVHKDNGWCRYLYWK